MGKPIYISSWFSSGRLYPELPCYHAVLAVQDCSKLEVTMADTAPVDKGSKEGTFTALATDFGFDDKVRGLFLSGHMEI